MAGKKTSSSGQTLSRPELVDGLRTVGVKAGDIVFAHSVMWTFGHVVDSVLEVVGAAGTFVVPISAGAIWIGPRRTGSHGTGSRCADLRHSGSDER